ncbi:MAG TPA: hypothetical protein PKC12_02330 [Thiobacillaceae bacterium]|nr:hypothetical protein [Thiobacillaceae bacterium]
MAQLPPAVEQVLRVHAAFIHTVVDALRDRSRLPELMKQLDAAEEAGWTRLVAALRQVIDGRRDPSIRLGLDDEDRILIDAILRGVDDPATLPPLDAQPDGSAAAPGLAALIVASAQGDVQAMSVLANMAEQMTRAGGDMALLGGRMRRLVNGERDADKLVAGMGPLGRELLISVLDELARLRPH